MIVVIHPNIQIQKEHSALVQQCAGMGMAHLLQHHSLRYIREIIVQLKCMYWDGNNKMLVVIHPHTQKSERA